MDWNKFLGIGLRCFLYGIYVGIVGAIVAYISYKTDKLWVSKIGLLFLGISFISVITGALICISAIIGVFLY